MVKIIAIIGEAGSGKDYLVKTIANKDVEIFNEIIPCTTRPKRESEREGVNYYFLSLSQFEEYQAEGKMLETTSFKNWKYGTLLNSLNKDKINIGVFNPEGVIQLLDNNKIQIKVYRLLVNPRERLLRQLQRETNPDVDEIVRRYQTDNIDFKHIGIDTIDLINNNMNQLRNNIKQIRDEALADWDNND